MSGVLVGAELTYHVGIAHEPRPYCQAPECRGSSWLSGLAQATHVLVYFKTWGSYFCESCAYDRLFREHSIPKKEPFVLPLALWQEWQQAWRVYRALMGPEGVLGTPLEPPVQSKE